jgi:hypothetical protein
MQVEDQKRVQEIWSAATAEVRQEVRTDIFNLFIKLREVFPDAKFLKVKILDEDFKDIFTYDSEFVRTTRT